MAGWPILPSFFVRSLRSLMVAPAGFEPALWLRSRLRRSFHEGTRSEAVKNSVRLKHGLIIGAYFRCAPCTL